MKKTITADGKEIVLQTNGLMPLLYKKELGRDFFGDVISLMKKDIDVEVAYGFLWCFAKIADKTIPELWEWAVQFETFPILDFLPIITEMVTTCISTKKTADTSVDSKKKTTNF